jgi:hypothetical protein
MSDEQDATRFTHRAAAIASLVAGLILLALGVRGAIVGDISQVFVGVAGVLLSAYVGYRRYRASRR